MIVKATWLLKFCFIPIYTFPKWTFLLVLPCSKFYKWFRIIIQKAEWTTVQINNAKISVMNVWNISDYTSHPVASQKSLSVASPTLLTGQLEHDDDGL